MHIEELETERLILRAWYEEDVAPFAALCADPRVMEFFPHCYSQEESEAAVARVQSHMQQHGWGFWALERKDNGQFIGFTGLNMPSMDLPFSPCVEVGWRLAADQWGQGFAPEAASASLDFAFNALFLQEVVSMTPLQNLRSQRVMEKLGMRRDAETFLHPEVPETSPLQEHCLYRIQPESDSVSV